MKRIFAAFLLFFVAAPPAHADFEKAAPGRVWAFPRDHGTHPTFRTEWWYVTGHLHAVGHGGDQLGRTFGFQWTVFRNALNTEASAGPRSAWRADQIYLGHLAVTDLEGRRFHFEDAAFREALGLAGASAQELAVRLPGFEAKTENDRLRLTATTPSIGLNLSMPFAAPVLQGENGYSRKSSDGGNASHYYSMPQLRPSGKLTLGGKIYEVEGTAWLDHEFSSGHLSEHQTGWDWMGLPLTEASSLMIYRLRDKRGTAHDYLSGTYIDETGTVHRLDGKDIRLASGSPWKSPHSGASYPSEWTVEIPAHGLKLAVTSDLEDQELRTARSTQITYWEGSVSVKGSARGKAIDSKGYLEMTGYAGALGL